MCVASPEPGRRAAAQFAALRRAADDLGLEGCSMGMSGDLEAALRGRERPWCDVGTALFGPRPSTPWPPRLA